MLAVELYPPNFSPTESENLSQEITQLKEGGYLPIPQETIDLYKTKGSIDIYSSYVTVITLNNGETFLYYTNKNTEEVPTFLDSTLYTTEHYKVELQKDGKKRLIEMGEKGDAGHRERTEAMIEDGFIVATADEIDALFEKGTYTKRYLTLAHSKNPETGEAALFYKETDTPTPVSFTGDPKNSGFGLHKVITKENGKQELKAISLKEAAQRRFIEENPILMDQLIAHGYGLQDASLQDVARRYRGTEGKFIHSIKLTDEKGKDFFFNTAPTHDINPPILAIDLPNQISTFKLTKDQFGSIQIKLVDQTSDTRPLTAISMARTEEIPLQRSI
ncbi:hypothetical protein KKG22_04120 [Patescibacteria group bacterium]|nr:hypothetical protein [Patescibacteria group bacterium]MBU1721328.1 hypothetical protein [Patescibacteria group bacterium]MBU1901613.1 hypothetical protein [Patescibacteria group bacterium]